MREGSAHDESDSAHQQNDIRDFVCNATVKYIPCTEHGTTEQNEGIRRDGRRDDAEQNDDQSHRRAVDLLCLKLLGKRSV